MYRSRNHRDTFSTYSPVINFTFFIGAVVFGMVLIHPGFLVCSVVSAVIYYLIVKGRHAVKLLAGLIPVLAAVTLINPLLNTQGGRILQRLCFTEWRLRRYLLLWCCGFRAIMS